MDKPQASFTIEQLLEQIQREEPTNCLTILEFCKRAGLSASKANKSRIKREIDELRAEGTWEMKTKQYFYEDMGFAKETYCYMPVEEGGDA